ncbi:MAG: hypothetical protein AAGC73_08155 [Verrucomicrobiota bacterium]
MGAYLVLTGSSIVIPGFSELWLFLIQILCTALNYTLVQWLNAEPLPIPQNPQTWIGLLFTGLGFTLVLLSMRQERVIITDSEKEPDGGTRIKTIVMTRSKDTNATIEARMHRALKEAATQKKVLKMNSSKKHDGNSN